MDVALGMGRVFNVTLPENFRQPVFSRTVFLRDVVNRDGCAWVYIVGVNFAGVFSIISVLIFLRWDVQVFECLQIFLKI